MSKYIQLDKTCYPIKPCHAPSDASACAMRNERILAEQIVDEIRLHQRMCLSIRLQECSESIQSIERMEYENAVQRWMHIQNLCSKDAVLEIPVKLYFVDTCGEQTCRNGVLQIPLALHPIRYDACTSDLLNILVAIEMKPLCIVRQSGGILELEAMVCVHGYLSCPGVYCVRLPVRDRANCVFPPLYPQPCRQKKTRSFDE